MRMREVLKPLPDDNILTVTCGNLVGNLHRDRFFCPGIHRECIEINGMFVTPKRFSVMGEKARLKDWKNAVRLNGFQLRKYIDSGILKFSNHESMCTGRCIARAPGARSGPAADTLLPQETKLSRPLGIFTTVEGNNMMKIKQIPSEDQWSNGDTEEDVKPDVNQLQLQMLQAQSMSVNKTYTASPSRVTKTILPHIYPTHITPVVPMVPPDEGDMDMTEEDCEDRLLWKGIVELGLVDEFFREIKASLDGLKNGMIKRQVPLSDSRKISVIVKELGLMQKLKYKLEAHQTDMERQRQKLDREMEELQRKVREFEAKKALLKRKSECFEQLLDITAPKTEQSWGEGSCSPSGYGSPSGFRRIAPNPVESDAGQLSVVFPQQMSSEESVVDNPTHYVINMSSDAASTSNSYPEDLSTTITQQSGGETTMNYVITSAQDLSKSGTTEESTEDQDTNGEKDKTNYTVLKDYSSEMHGDVNSSGLKVKVRRGRKRKPREIPRTDPSEEFVIQMEQAMDEDGDSALNYATGTNDSPGDCAKDCEDEHHSNSPKDKSVEKLVSNEDDSGSPEGEATPVQQSEEDGISGYGGEDVTNGTSDNQSSETSPSKTSVDFTGVKVNRRGRKRKSRDVLQEESTSP